MSFKDGSKFKLFLIVLFQSLGLMFTMWMFVVGAIRFIGSIDFVFEFGFKAFGSSAIMFMISVGVMYLGVKGVLHFSKLLEKNILALRS